VTALRSWFIQSKW